MNKLKTTTNKSEYKLKNQNILTNCLTSRTPAATKEAVTHKIRKKVYSNKWFQQWYIFLHCIILRPIYAVSVNVFVNMLVLRAARSVFV